jgi:hypothetical protein
MKPNLRSQRISPISAPTYDLRVDNAVRTTLLAALLGFFAVLLLTLVPLRSSAAMIEFHLSAANNGPATVFEYLTEDGPLTGTNLIIDEIIGTDTPLNPDVILPCENCALNFTTGDLISYNASTLHWTFGGGASSSINITGDVPAIGVVGENLQQATFSAPVQVFQVLNGYTITFANHNSTPNSSIASYYGVASTPSPNNGNIQITSIVPTVNPDGTFSTSTILSGDVTLELAAIPEPGTALLLGLGLAGLTHASRRRNISPKIE